MPLPVKEPLPLPLSLPLPASLPSFSPHFKTNTVVIMCLIQMVRNATASKKASPPPSLKRAPTPSKKQPPPLSLLHAGLKSSLSPKSKFCHGKNFAVATDLQCVQEFPNVVCSIWVWNVALVWNVFYVPILKCYMEIIGNVCWILNVGFTSGHCWRRKVF